MPKTTNENDKLKEAKVTKTEKVTESAKSSPKTKSTTSKSSTSKSTSTKTTKGTKSTAAKSTKAIQDSAKSTAKTATKSTTKTAEKVVAEKKTSSPKTEKKKTDEASVIEKIKSFLAKIVAMQNEALEEEKANEKNGTEQKQPKKEKNVTVKTEKTTPYMLEYYDLPYRYNETVVKILAQTPKRLFVYWDISDNDREKYVKAFGEKFFEETYPVLLVHNEEKNYTFEVPINDFANSWYLDINDTKSKYVIQLGRKFKTKPTMINIAGSNDTKDVILKNDYVPISTSNTLEVPNDHILFENLSNKVTYRNVKNNNEFEVDLSNEEFTKRIGKIYTIYDVYKKIYENEIDIDSLKDLSNPSSHGNSRLFNPSSMSSSRMGRS